MVSHDRLFRIDCSNEYPFLPLLKNMYSDEFDVEIMQYTGLHDKNGKEIYEGDIIPQEVVLSQKLDDGWERLIGKEIVNFQVVYDQSRALYALRSIEHGDRSFSLWKKPILNGEVIGNIYENAELLEVSQ